MGRFAALQAVLRERIETADDVLFAEPLNRHLSPLGWHLAHCVYVECYWLREVLAGDDRITRPLSADAWPEFAPKAGRGARLPARDRLLAWAEALQAENGRLLAAALGGPGRLLADDYLLHFLIGHHVQHLETIDTARVHAVLARPEGYVTPHPLFPCSPEPDLRSVAAGTYRVGADAGSFAFDNEGPARQAMLQSFAIAGKPVSNAEYLAFMTEGGYGRSALWSTAGRQWLQETGAHAPAWWKRGRDGEWHGATATGPCPLAPDAPVTGVSFHEAEAFARWADCRLPREAEWETAARAGLLEESGQVWEWCADLFHPYPGFAAYPYDGYSRPWFDGRHHVLRGGSLLSAPEVTRPSFRNFYTADIRHIPAGFRLAR